MRGFSKVLIGIFLAITSCSTPELTVPNVLLIITDDQGWGDVGFNGNGQIDTPHLDWLAENSTQFERFYVSPVCAPTRASVLTGRYHLSTGTSWVTHRKEVMRSSEVTIAEMLKEKGYRTGIYGKWHNGKQYPHDPLGQGFDRFTGFSDGHINNYFNTTLQSQHEKIKTSGYLPDVLTDAAMNFMLESEEPYFCYLSYNTPHGPFQLPDSLFDKYKSRGFDDKTASVYGMVENIDHNVGRLLQRLKENDQLENTVLIFMTDNGPNGVRYNGGFKGIKAHVDEGGVRVPFLIKYDAVGWDYKKIDEMAGHIDILPTLAELCDIHLPDSLEIDGKSLVSPLSGISELPSRQFFTHQVIRDLDTLPGAVRTDQYLLTLKNNETGLFDLIADPGQRNDVSGELPGKVKELKAAYYKWFYSCTHPDMSPEPIEVGHTSIPEIEIPAPDASVLRSLDFKGGMGWAHDYLINWNDSSFVSWKIRSVERANYSVFIQLANGEASNVVLDLAIGDDTIRTAVDRHLEAPVIPAPDRHQRGGVFERAWHEVEIGQLQIHEGLHDLTLRATTLKQPDIEVKGIILRKPDNDL